MDAERLDRQMRFLHELDKLTRILRQTLLLDGSRQENDAEHCWNLAVTAIVLGEHSAVKGIDLGRVIRMALVHDVVEIDAGDTYCYDAEGNKTRAERERRAADRIFALLPEDQGREIRDLWEEFEAQHTAEARFAAALDRLQPLMHNYATQGVMWRKHGVNSRDVREKNRHIAAGSQVLWEFAEGLIDDAVRRGWLAP